MVKQFLLDAGSHSFESSLIWLTCAYSQRQMDLDSIHGWEATLLEPKKFWSEVRYICVYVRVYIHIFIAYKYVFISLYVY